MGTTPEVTGGGGLLKKASLGMKCGQIDFMERSDTNKWRGDMRKETKSKHTHIRIYRYTYLHSLYI